MPIFIPGTESLKRDYPILKTYEEFKVLTDNELLFVWYYACKSSPYYGIKEKSRGEKAIEILRDMKEYVSVLSEDEYNEIVDKKFKPHMADAIKRMSKFEPRKREIANSINDRILEDLQEISQISLEEHTKLEDKKVILDMKITIAKNLPNIIEAAEGGYGSRKIEREENKKQLSQFEQD